jgi:thiamine-monophosphate kinase
MSGRRESLGDLGEREILNRILRPRYRDTVGFGDDCAVLRAPSGGGDLVATTDTCPTPLVAQLGDTDPYYAGWLLATINLSDLAAAGALPLGLVVNYTLPKHTAVADFERLLDGVDACVAEHHTTVIGGDLRDGEQSQLSATAIGECVPDRRLRRVGASAGDRLLLVGMPGYLWAAALLEAGQATVGEADALAVRTRARLPKAQLTAGRILAESGLARAAMDVSDGLFATVRTLCEANDLGAEMTTHVGLDPVLADICRQSGVSEFDLATTWGDWSLLVVVAERDVATARQKLAAESIAARPIGTLVDPVRGITVGDGDAPGEWLGVAQERFSTRSWHGSDFGRWLADLLSVPTP